MKEQTHILQNPKKKSKKVKTEADYDQEFAEVKRKYNNMQEYDKELSKITNDLFMPTDGSVETLEKVDKAYGTNYKKAASAIAFQDMANRGKYVKHQQMYDSAGNPIYGRTTGKVDQPTIEDMTISLNPDYYLEGTANHEISHLADALVNKVHSADATNNYMEYLLDRDNIMSYNEIRQSLMDVNPSTYRYLTTPSENKAHMIQLKRGMQKEGLINNWTDPITQDKIEEYLSYRSKYANRVNPVLRTLYDIRPDKQGFINRMNNMKELEGVYPLYPVPSYKKGGIHIKKSKRGTFKAAAKKAGMGVQEYANKVLKKGSKASPAMKKKAVFARNSAKWNH